jgi:2'-5' RNA ligase
MTVKRVFIAFDISPEAREAAAGHIDGLKLAFPHCLASWTQSDKLHFTLRFLGDVETGRVDSVCEAADEAAKKMPPFRISLAGAGVFPSAKKARILWLGTHGEVKSAQSLKQRLEVELRRAAFESDPRTFTPHLTIARIKDPNACGLLTDFHLKSEIATPRFLVKEIIVIESSLKPSGSVYTVISKSAFAGIREN